MLAEFIWDFNPDLIEIGPFTIRYYGVIFMLSIVAGMFFWTRQMRRGGYSRDVADGFFLWGVLAVVIGARLGHCFFYYTDYYLAHLREVLLPNIFEQRGLSGLSSHGATVGLTLTLIIYSVVRKLPVLDITDRFAMSAACGATGVRLGNFLNSEIVGRATDLPWAVHFIRSEDYGDVPRHPSQLYEFALGIFVLLTLLLVDKLAGKEKRPRALMTGLFLTLYFAGWFCVEFVKEYHINDFRANSPLTMGQYLSIIPFTAGVILLIYASFNARKAKRAAAA